MMHLLRNSFLSHKNATITKLTINEGHEFQSFSWLSLLTSLEELTIYGDFDTVLDLSNLPHVTNRELSVTIEGSFQNIINWQNTEATALSFYHIELSQLNPEDWAPKTKWGQKLKSFCSLYSLPFDFDNLEPANLQSFRSYNVYASLTKRSSSYAVQVEYRMDDLNWELLFHQSEVDYAIEIGAFKLCQQKLGVAASPLECALFIVDTLCGIDFLNDNITEAFEEE